MMMMRDDGLAQEGSDDDFCKKGKDNRVLIYCIAFWCGTHAWSGVASDDE
jgi:hypothetical protein